MYFKREKYYFYVLYIKKLNIQSKSILHHKAFTKAYKPHPQRKKSIKSLNYLSVNI